MFADHCCSPPKANRRTGQHDTEESRIPLYESATRSRANDVPTLEVWRTKLIDRRWRVLRGPRFAWKSIPARARQPGVGLKPLMTGTQVPTGPNHWAEVKNRAK